MRQDAPGRRQRVRQLLMGSVGFGAPGGRESAGPQRPAGERAAPGPGLPPAGEHQRFLLQASESGGGGRQAVSGRLGSDQRGRVAVG